MRIIIVGKSGSGKDTYRDLLIAKGLKPSISFTTRPPRKNEIEGKDYYFISKNDFHFRLHYNEFYEFVTFNGWSYGTTNRSMLNDNVFIMTPRGISKLTVEDRKSSLVIYLDLPDEVLIKRIAKRSKMTGDSILRRFEADKIDFDGFIDFDIRITNSDFNDNYYKSK